jgi:hypothetical protein
MQLVRFDASACIYIKEERRLSLHIKEEVREDLYMQEGLQGCMLCVSISISADTCPYLRMTASRMCT